MCVCAGSVLIFNLIALAFLMRLLQLKMAEGVSGFGRGDGGYLSRIQSAFVRVLKSLRNLKII